MSQDLSNQNQEETFEGLSLCPARTSPSALPLVVPSSSPVDLRNASVSHCLKLLRTAVPPPLSRCAVAGLLPVDAASVPMLPPPFPRPACLSALVDCQ